MSSAKMMGTRVLTTVLSFGFFISDRTAAVEKTFVSEAHHCGGSLFIIIRTEAVLLLQPDVLSSFLVSCCTLLDLSRLLDGLVDLLCLRSDEDFFFLLLLPDEDRLRWLLESERSCDVEGGERDLQETKIR